MTHRRVAPRDLPSRATARGGATCRVHYRWLGELSHWRARRLIARSRVLVLSSRMEGGAHVIAEAVTCGTAVLASEIDGTIGQLGAD